jgi:hypothetical protein
MERITNAVAILESDKYTKTLDLSIGGYRILANSGSQIDPVSGNIYIFRTYNSDKSSHADEVIVYDSKYGEYISFNSDLSMETAYMREYTRLISGISSSQSTDGYTAPNTVEGDK